MVDLNSKIAGSWARILRGGAVHPLTMAVLLLAGSSALAQENRGTEQQRVACAPDVLRLCFSEIPNADRIIVLTAGKIPVECRLPSSLRGRRARGVS